MGKLEFNIGDYVMLNKDNIDNPLSNISLGKIYKVLRIEDNPGNPESPRFYIINDKGHEDYWFMNEGYWVLAEDTILKQLWG